MVREISTSSASASSAPVPVRSVAAANPAAGEGHASAVSAVESGRAQQVSVAIAEQTFRYNSFQFIYRQDIGRIVLIGQSPETGERVVQVPSEQVLRAYARTARAERQAAASQQDNKAPAPEPAAQPVPQLAQALAAVVGGGNNGSGVVRVSA